MDYFKISMTSPPILKHLQPQEKSDAIFIIHLEKNHYCYCIIKICILINKVVISDMKKILFSTVNIIKLNHVVRCTRREFTKCGKYASGTIYYVHICPQSRLLSSSVIKRLYVFLRKQAQTLSINHDAKYMFLCQ